jgi:hypothetical protein
MNPIEIQKFADKSAITFKAMPRNRVSVAARFVYKSARYEVNGVIDLDKRRAEAFTHRFSLGSQKVFDSLMAIGDASVRNEFSFGNATSGARKLALRTELLQKGALVTGSADGEELLPIVANGCSCKHSGAARSMLAWDKGTTTKAISIHLKSSRAAGDIEGLAEVMQTTIARTNNGAFGGDLGKIIGCIEYGLCLLNCAFQYVLCVLGSLGLPESDIFITLCSVGPGQCVMLCNFEHTFPS